ncbi:hypothetical protein D3C85_1802810 [compost metagenome]
MVAIFLDECLELGFPIAQNVNALLLPLSLLGQIIALGVVLFQLAGLSGVTALLLQHSLHVSRCGTGGLTDDLRCIGHGRDA